MNLAVTMTGLCIIFAFASAVALFVIEQDLAAWMTLIVALLSVIILLGMIASTAKSASVTPINGGRAR